MDREQSAWDEYLLRVWSHWKAVVTGVVAGFLGLAWNGPPGWLLVGLGVLSLFYAQFRAFIDVRRDRNNERLRATSLENEIRLLRQPVFPSHHLKIGRPWFVVRENGDRLVVIDVAFWNRQPDRDMSLEVRAFYAGDGGGLRDGMGPYRLFLTQDVRDIKTLLQFPLPVIAMRDISGLLILDADQVPLVPGNSDMGDVFIRPGWKCFLEVEDYISNAKTTTDVEMSQPPPEDAEAPE